MAGEAVLVPSENDELFALAQEAGRVGIFEWQVQAGLVRLSSRFLALYGLAEFDGHYESWLGCIFQDDRWRVTAQMEAAFAERRPDTQAEFRIVSPDSDQPRWIESRNRIFYDPEGSAVRVVGVHVDVTERKDALADLRAFTDTLQNAVRDRTRDLAANSEFTAKVLEHSPDCIAVLDLDGRLRFVNHGSHRFLDIDDFRPFEGGLIDGLFPVGSRDLLRAAITRGGRGEASQFLAFYHSKGSSAEWWEVSISAMQGADGLPERLLCIARNVTLREEQSRQQQEAKEAAHRARAHAEAASQAKSDFLAAMSHEIRTPLTGILGYTDVLLRADLGPHERKHAERIQSAGMALLTVVNDILDFSKIEAGQAQLDPRPFGLRSLVESAVSIVEGFAQSKGLALAVEVAPAVPDGLVGDPDRLRQILLNLLNNAIKFTRQGRVGLTVIAEGDSAGGLRFAVTDTGIGIPSSKLKGLFQRFSQVDGSIGRLFGGTGLGLAISKQLVELMGGTIGVESRPDVGSVFWFRLALPLAGEVPAEPARGDAPADRDPPRPARILLAEDLEINQDLIRLVLETGGHEVDIVADGEAAVAAVQARTYDLVLMDVQMPGMDGLTATTHIRSLPDRAARAIPIIAMTASVLPNQVTAFRRVGMDDHVGKPFKPKQLLSIIEDLMRTRRAAPPKDAAARAPAVLDADAHRDLGRILGESRLTELVDEIDERAKALIVLLSRVGEGGAVSPGRLGAGAHALVSIAGQVGFGALSALCRELEEAAEAGQADLGLSWALRIQQASLAARIASAAARAVAREPAASRSGGPEPAARRPDGPGPRSSGARG